MKPKRLAYQRDRSDCVRCSLASLLGLSYRAVPDFWKRYRKWETQLLAVEKWLNKRGYALLYMDKRRSPDCYYLGQTLCHMVVMRKGRITHDPNPKGNTNRRDIDRCWLVVPKDVGKHSGR